MEQLKKLIREIPDYPKPGILFYDITTLLKDKQGFHALVDGLCKHYEKAHVDLVAGIEARGFILGPALPTAWARDSCQFASPKNFRAKLPKCRTSWNTVRIPWKSMKTRSSAVSES